MQDLRRYEDAAFANLGSSSDSPATEKGMYEPDCDGRKAHVPDLGLTHLMESRMR